MQTPKVTFGNYSFGANGVTFERPYDSQKALENAHESMSASWTDEDEKKVHLAIIDHIKGRLNHCVESLQKNIHNAVVITKDEVIWDRGYFCVNTATRMQELVQIFESFDNFRSWITLSKYDLELVLKSLYEGHSTRYHGKHKDIAFNRILGLLTNN